MYTTFFAEKNQKRRGHFVCHVAKVVGDLVAKLGQHSHVGSLIGAKKGYSGVQLSDLSEAKKKLKRLEGEIWRLTEVNSFIRNT